MNALDLRADHPELLRPYTPSGRQPNRLVAALRRLLVPSARLEATPLNPAAAR